MIERKRFPFGLVLIFGSFWVLFAAFGQVLAARYGFLTSEGAAISMRAIVAAQGDGMTMATLDLPQPPLPYFMAIPFAMLGLQYPAIWVSAMMAAILCTWYFASFRLEIENEPVLVILPLLVPLQPGVLAGGAGGTAGITAVALLAFASYFGVRFTLERQAFEEMRAAGRMSAWVSSERYQGRRVRFLWSAALLLGLAGFAKSSLIVALPIYLMAIPFLLPGHERRDIPKILTLALLLFMPVVAVHLMWMYAGWVLNDDPWRGLAAPDGFVSQLRGVDVLPAVKMAPALAMGHVALGMLATCAVFVYVLVRLRSVSVFFLCIAPFSVEVVALMTGHGLQFRGYLTLTSLLAMILIFLGAKVGRFGPLELKVLAGIMCLGTAGSWIYFSASPQREDRAFAALVSGRPEELFTFPGQRAVAAMVSANPGMEQILMDERAGFGVIAILNRFDPFILSHQSRYRFANENPNLGADLVAVRREEWEWRKSVAAQEGWLPLEAARTAAFRPLVETDDWLLLERKTGGVASKQ